MRFSSLIIKNLTRRPARTLLTLLALSTAIASVVALIGVANGFSSSFADIYAAHSVDVVVSRDGSADRLSSSVDAAMVERIGQLPQVERTAGVLLETLSLEEEGVYGLPTMGIALDSWLLKDYSILRASPSSANNAADRSQSETSNSSNAVIATSGQVGSAAGGGTSRIVFLGIHLAERIGAKAGGEILLFDETYRVEGVFESPSTWENGSMILPLEQLQSLTDREGQVTYINVILDRTVVAGSAGTVADQAIEGIEALDSRLLALATSEFVETDLRMQMAGAMAWMTSAIALIIGSIGTLNTMLTSVMERTREIGILRAIGWPKKRIVAMVMCESCGLAIVASAIGCIVAIILVRLLSEAPAAKGILSPTIAPAVILQGVVLSLCIGLIGAILPAIRAAGMLPSEAFRASS